MATFSNSNPFQVNMFIEKNFITDEPDGTRKMRIKGVASGPKLDRQHHKFSKMGLLSIKKAIEEGLLDEDGDRIEIPLLLDHKTGMDNEIGWVVKADLDDEGQLWIEAELDETSSKAQELYRKMSTPRRNGKPRKFGLSVKGVVTKYQQVWDDVVQKMVPLFDNLQLSEISVTPQPCYPADAYVAIVKSLNPANDMEVPMSDQTDNQTNNTQVESDTVVSPESAHLLEEQVAVEEADKTVKAPNEEVVEEVVADEGNKDEVLAEEVAVEGNVNSDTERNEIEQPAEDVKSEVVEDAEKTDAPAEVPAGYAVHPQNQEVVEVSKAVTELTERFVKIEKALDSLLAKENTEPVTEQEEKGETVEVQKSEVADSDLDVRIEKIVTGVIGKLSDELTVVKSMVEEISQEPADKSVSIVKSKADDEVQTPEQYFRHLVETGTDPISAGVRTGIRFNQQG